MQPLARYIPIATKLHNRCKHKRIQSIHFALTLLGRLINQHTKVSRNNSIFRCPERYNQNTCYCYRVHRNHCKDSLVRNYGSGYGTI